MPEEHPIEMIQEMLKLMVGRKASDLFLSVGFPPAFKIDGKVTPISKQLLTAAQTQDFARALMNDKQLASFETIKKFVILSNDFSIEGGELTPSMKIRRSFINKRYKTELDTMYAS